MKKVIVTAFFAVFSMGAFAQSNTGNIPGTAKDFIDKNFADLTVEEVKENSNWEIWQDEKFEVRLSNGIELDFDEQGNIIEIDSQNGEAIPESALSSNIANYLKSNHAGAKVIGWEKSDKEQEVELADGTEVEFDAEGNFRKLD